MYSKDTAPSNGKQQSRRDEVEAEKFMNQPQVIQEDACLQTGCLFVRVSS